ncbi:acyl-CoA dehydrogenase family protein [Streptomyces sp. NPDC059740]|uniref:acyl-CoA dehydrogenase family protein n=1 Tax=Streptomyces sp. NPDC059740 TaxID=3346926 RepID=UPI003646F5AF
MVSPLVADGSAEGAGARTWAEWAEALSRAAAAGRETRTLLAERTVLDVFGPGAWGGGAAEQPVAVSTAADGSARWSLGPDDAPVRRAELTADRARAVADRDLLAHAAVAVGTAERALVLARRRAGSRTVAGRPLIEMQSTGHRLARVAALVAVARISVRRAAQDEAAGVAAGHRAPAVAAGAAEAAFAVSHALVQVFGAAGTGDPAAIAAFEACQAAGAAAGPPAELWLQAGRRRELGRHGLPAAG